jgi:hypothetical protein
MVTSAGEWIALTAGVVLVGAGSVADRIGRRRSAHAHAGVRVWRRPGSIVLVASAVSALCAVVAVISAVVR